MFQFNTIRFNGTYLTEGSTLNGVPMLSEITPLGDLILNEVSKPFVAIDGTVHEQFNSLAGMSFSIKFDVLPQSLYGAMVSAIKASRSASTNLSLFIDGDQITDFRGLVRCTGIELTDRVIATGLIEPKFNFILTGLYNSLIMNSGIYEITGRPLDIIYSGV